MGLTGVIALIAFVAVQQVSANLFPLGPPDLNPNCPNCTEIFIGDMYVIIEICSECPCTITVTRQSDGKLILGPFPWRSVRKGFCLCETFQSDKDFTPGVTYIWNIECGGQSKELEITEGGTINGPTCPWTRGFGDPHWTTFDNLKYNFQGTAGCTYTWTKDCVNSNPSFEVDATLGVSAMANQLTRIESVTIKAHGFVITLLSENDVTIDGTTYDAGDFQVSQFFNGQDIQILAAVQNKQNGLGLTNVIIVFLHAHGIHVEYNGINGAQLLLMNANWDGTGNLCGLAGDSENSPDTTNDLKDPSGTIVATDASDQSLVDTFGNSWLVSCP